MHGARISGRASSPTPSAAFGPGLCSAFVQFASRSAAGRSIATIRAVMPRAQRGPRRRANFTNKKLGLKRANNAYAMFLKSVKGKYSTYRGKRLSGKQTVWRFDLMRVKFAGLPAGERKRFDDMAAGCKQTVAAARRAASGRPALGTPASAPAPRGAATAPATAGSPAAPAEVPESEAPATAGSTSSAGGPPTSIAPSLAQDELQNEVETLYFTQPGRTLVNVDVASGARQSLRLADDSALGSGSFGVCLSVEDPVAQAKFCAKFGRTGSGAEVARAALRKEMAAMSRMNHPNVMKAFSLIQSENGTALALLMPLATGCMTQWLKRAEYLHRTIASGGAQGLHRHHVACIYQLACGIAHMHGRAIVHLDLKPENVLFLDPPLGSVKAPVFILSDFGQCRSRVEADGIPDELLYAMHVNADEYRPPDLFHAAGCVVPPRPRYDLWAYGCMVWDVCHRHPRLRSSCGRTLRLFSGIDMKQDLQAVFRCRDYRLQKWCDQETADFAKKVMERPARGVNVTLTPQALVALAGRLQAIV